LNIITSDLCTAPFPLRFGASGFNSARYSFRKNRRVLRTGLGAVWPKPHKLVFFTMSHSSSNRSKSRAVALPSTSLFSARYICTVPVRQGTHFPQDSSMQNSMKNRAISTIRVVSSITIMPPEPMMDPNFMSES